MFSFFKKSKKVVELPVVEDIPVTPDVEPQEQKPIWSIDKTFNFEMGHRVWSQKLEHEDLSITTDCACKHLHGHSYEVKIELSSSELDQSFMVTDFKNLNFMKQFLDEILDHKFMVDINDPNCMIITTVSPYDIAIKENFLKNKIIHLGAEFPVDDENLQLHRDSFVIVDFCPTSENICKFLKDYAQSKIGNIATVSAVELWETKKSHCRYG